MASVFSEPGALRAWPRLRWARRELDVRREAVSSARFGYARHLRMLEGLLRQMQGAADTAFLAHLGWVVASPADAALPVDVMSRAAAGAGGRPETLALARFLVVRSVRCLRLGGIYRERARGVLQLHRQLRPDDGWVALWLSALYLLGGHYAEAHREAVRARGSPWEAVAGSLRAAAELMMAASLGAGRGDGRRAEASAGQGPWSGEGPGVGGRGGRAAARGPGYVRLVQGRPARLPGARVELWVRARQGQPVYLVGREGYYRLPPAEGELALGFLGLSWRGGC